MRILRAADRVAAPWKNGGGVTREVAACPPGSSLDDFSWRVSLAEVQTDGPFSTFKGVDRILTVLEGQLTLSIDGGQRIKRSSRSAPMFFAGDIPVAASVGSGTVVDLNVMTRRGVVSATVERKRVVGTLRLSSTPFTRVIFARCSLQVSGASAAVLARDDAVLLEPEEPPITVLATRGTILLISFQATHVCRYPA